MSLGRLRRWHLFAERLGERLSKSSRVFLIGLFVACGVEVAVDWNSTIEEINVLRASMRQKAEDYVDILRRAAQPAVEAYDWDALDELSRGLLDDEDVAYVRFTDALGNTLHDRLRDDYAATFTRTHKAPFREHYRHQMDRDLGGMLSDPAQLRARIAQSHHRDFIQGFNDFEDALLARVSSPPPAHAPPPQVLYQDRLYDDARQLDRSLSYGLGVITTDRGDPIGVVLLALRHDRMNRAVLRKLLKGLGITLFFVTLILVQNVLGRRAKLRLLALEQGLTGARMLAAVPASLAYGAGQVGVAFAPNDGASGAVCDVSGRADGSLDLLYAVVEGGGVDAAFAAIVLRDIYRWHHSVLDPAERMTRMLADYDASPRARDVELLCAHVDLNGYVRGVISGLRPPACVDAHGAVRSLSRGEPFALPTRHVRSAICSFVGSLSDGALAIFQDGQSIDRAGQPIDRAGQPIDRARAEPAAEAFGRLASRLRQRRPDAQAAAEEAVVAAVRASASPRGADIFCFVVSRSPRA